jgi:hypothetical protein
MKLLSALLLIAAATPPTANSVGAPPLPVIPMTRAIALDGHAVELPRDLGHSATVLILGFGRNSADTTTTWQKATHNALGNTPGVVFYDMQMLAEAPALIRPVIIRAIKRQVPEAVRPNFVPLTSDLDGWRQVAGFTPDAPDAAYVMLVDSSGRIRWQTHEPFTQARFDQLANAARTLPTK